MTAPDVTTLLKAWRDGRSSARDELVPLVYGELKRRAAAYLRRESPGHTLQPTALVNEVYLRLVNQRRADWVNRGQFFGVASQLMRRILVDHARAHKMHKRSGQWARVTLDDAIAGFAQQDVEVLDLDRALTALAALDPRKCQMAELRCFGGLTLEEAAETLAISRATAMREWQAARAFLYKALNGERHSE